jgi:hypothetical protein
MKYFVIVAVLVLVLAAPAFAQFRIDLGAIVPMTVGTLSGSGVETSGEIGAFLREHILPFPEASFYYQFNAGPVRLAPGVRAFTLILESLLWPNVLVELALGPVFIDAQLGGLFFVAFGLANNADAGKVLIPDLSVWVGLGKKRTFRLGGGVLGLMAPEISGDTMLILPYVGFKAAILFDNND